MASRESRTGTSESSTHITPKGYFDAEGVFTVDFTDKEEMSWQYSTEWTCMPSSGKCEIIHTREVNYYLCDLMHHFDRSPNVKVASLQNPDQKVILVFGHDTKDSAFAMILKFIDVRNRVLTLLHKGKIPVEDIKVSVRLQGTKQPAAQHKGNKCMFDSTPGCSPKYKLETKWVCTPDPTSDVADNERSSRHFTQLKEAMSRCFRADLMTVWRGSMIFIFYHENTKDALEMITKHKEVRAMMLACLQRIDSSVKDIQMEAQLQNFIDSPQLLEPGHQDKGYVNKEEHDQIVAALKQQQAETLEKLNELQQAQLADTRMTMWMKPDAPQPSESSGYFTATDTMADVSEEQFQDTEELSEAEGGVSKPRQKSQSVIHLTRQLADLKQELKATTDRMHRLETRHKKAPDTDTGREPSRRDTPQGSDQHGGASSHPSEMEALRPGATQESELPAISREEETRKSGIPLGPDTRATPTPACGDPEADCHLRDASWEGNMAAVKRILAAGRADVNCRDESGRTSVMRAALRGHRDVVELLVSEGADVSLVDKDGFNILHVACMGGDVETVKCVLSLHVADINSIAVWSTTPVMWAAVEGHRDVVEFLVSEGADVSLVDKDGDNILHFACCGGDVETVKFVLSLHVVDINSRGRRSWTPVMRAAWRGHRDVVELLVSEGADVSLVNEVGNNILHYACIRGDVETVKYVLSLHEADINSRGGGSRTPVMRAADMGHRYVVELLVSRGADVSLVNEVGNNTLHYACMGGDVETVKYVLSLHVADIDARNNAGETAADLARRRGHQEIVKLL